MESGEGIESILKKSQHLNLPFADPWNPVKELKGEPYPRGRLPLLDLLVESGEGIERFMLFEVRCRCPCHVESGEGIESSSAFQAVLPSKS